MSDDLINFDLKKERTKMMNMVKILFEWCMIPINSFDN